MNRLFVAALVLFSSLFSASAADQYIKREMRSAWLATVWGLDWPTNTGTSASTIAKQKAELNTILDNLKAAGMNAVSFQVRSMADAMYKSSYEPWSRFLTGTRGTAPSDASWDPLAYCVEQCHARGMECHAWVNPFRFNSGATLPSTSLDMVARNAGWVLTYKKTNSDGSTSTTSILDPGNAAARQRIVNVCKEIISNYDVDGLMFDDYFYPEGMPLGSGYDYDEYKASGTSMTQANWRRDNVRKAVKEVYTMIQSVKPYVKFGISPAGVGGGPNGEAAKVYGLPKCYGGYDWIYNGIYCDPLPWLADKTIDYISPQIYWTRASTANPYEPIAKWWSEVADHFGRHFYASHSIETFESTNTTAAWQERGAQIDINRKYTLNAAPGSIFYSVKFISGPTATGFGNYLGTNHFKVKALTPALTWKSATNPGQVTGLTRSGNNLTWNSMSSTMRYVAYAIPESLYPEDAMTEDGKGFRSEYIIDVAYKASIEIPSDRRTGYWYAVAPYDRHSNEWTATTLDAPSEEYSMIRESDADTTIVGTDGTVINLKNLWVRSAHHGSALRLKSDNNYNRDIAVRAADSRQTDGDIVYMTNVTSVSLPSECSLMRYDALTGERLADLPLTFEDTYASVGYTNLNGITTDDKDNLVVHNLKIGNNPIFIGKVDPKSGYVTHIVTLTTDNTDRIDHFDVSGDVDGTFYVFGASADSNKIYRWTVKNEMVKETQSVVATENIGTAPRVIALSADKVMINGAQSHLMMYSFPDDEATNIYAPSPAATRANGGARIPHAGKYVILYPEKSYDPGFRFRMKVAGINTFDGVTLPAHAQGLGTVNPPSGDYGCIAKYYKSGTEDSETTRFYLFACNNGMAAYELTSPVAAVELPGVDPEDTATVSVEGYEVSLGCVAQSARLFDAKGALVASGRGVEKLTVGAPGVYVLRMVTDAGASVTQKIVVE